MPNYKKDFEEIVAGMVEHLAKPSRMIARIGERAMELKDTLLREPKKRGDIYLQNKKEQARTRSLRGRR